MLILMEQRHAAQGGIQVVQQGDVGSFVEAGAFLEQAMLRQQLLGVFVTTFGQMNLMALFINPVIAFSVFFRGTSQIGDNVLHAQVEIGVIIRLA